MLHPDLYEATLQPKNKLEEDLYSSNTGPKACVVAYVSKMFAVPAKELPENKKRAFTADEMREKARAARAARQAEADGSAKQDLAPNGVEYNPESEPPKPQEPKDNDAEVVLGFARLYSGTVRVGTSVYALLPKYNSDLEPTHPSNVNYILTAMVEGLYVMMGRELVPIPQVRAGNIFAIKGLESKVWRSATLCAPEEIGIGENANPAEQKDCLVNLGKVDRAVKHSCIMILVMNFVLTSYLGCSYCPSCIGTV